MLLLSHLLSPCHKVLIGELVATSGEVIRDRRARIQLVNQHHADQLDLDSTPLLYMLEKFPGTGTYVMTPQRHSLELLSPPSLSILLCVRVPPSNLPFLLVSCTILLLFTRSKKFRSELVVFIFL
jgi:hypothetical protein